MQAAADLHKLVSLQAAHSSKTKKKYMNAGLSFIASANKLDNMEHEILNKVQAESWKIQTSIISRVKILKNVNLLTQDINQLWQDEDDFFSLYTYTLPTLG